MLIIVRGRGLAWVGKEDILDKVQAGERSSLQIKGTYTEPRDLGRAVPEES